MEEKRLNITGNEYVFTYLPDLDAWSIPESDIVKGHLLNVVISLKEFRESSLQWEDVTAFINYVHEHNSWLVEKITAAKAPLLNLVDAFFKDGIELDQMDLEPVGIYYKGVRNTAAGERAFSYSIFYSLFDTRDPYEDMGMFLWSAVFVGQQISGVEFDL